MQELTSQTSTSLRSTRRIRGYGFHGCSIFKHDCKLINEQVSKLFPSILHNSSHTSSFKKSSFHTTLERLMANWYIEILEFDSSFGQRKALKSQVFAYFFTELTPATSESCIKWTVFTYGSNNRGSGSNFILECDKWLIVKLSMNFDFSPLTMRKRINILSLVSHWDHK